MDSNFQPKVLLAFTATCLTELVDNRQKRGVFKAGRTETQITLVFIILLKQPHMSYGSNINTDDGQNLVNRPNVDLESQRFQKKTRALNVLFLFCMIFHSLIYFIYFVFDLVTLFTTNSALPFNSDYLDRMQLREFLFVVIMPGSSY